MSTELMTHPSTCFIVPHEQSPAASFFHRDWFTAFRSIATREYVKDIIDSMEQQMLDAAMVVKDGLRGTERVMHAGPCSAGGCGAMSSAMSLR